VLAVSVDPANDTPASARAFLARNHVSGLIRFLIGPRSALAKVWKLMGIAPEMPESSHSAYVFLVDRKGTVRTGWPADHLTPEGLAHDMLVVLGK
jgi:protein SCO1/2